MDDCRCDDEQLTDDDDPETPRDPVEDPPRLTEFDRLEE